MENKKRKYKKYYKNKTYIINNFEIKESCI